MNTVHIQASKAYDIHIGPGLLSHIGALIQDLGSYRKVCIVSDSNVWPLYGEKVRSSLLSRGIEVLSFVFPAGEQNKNADTYLRLLNHLAENSVTRSDLLIALGGGVVGDLTGFAAATYLRGISFIQIPTTLLAAVDASIGGKTAIDLPAGKNLAGAFYQPSLVLCDTETLNTLPGDVFLDGCAEVIKYGVLGNAEFFRELQETPIADQLEHVIAVCVAMKRDLVEDDEFDTGARRLLNLGHSIAHGVEKCSSFTVSHGSAVAMGMAAITRAAVEFGICDEESLAALLALLERNGLPTTLPYTVEELYQASLSDKKIAGGAMHLVVPETIGRCRIVAVHGEEMRRWLQAGGAQ